MALAQAAHMPFVEMPESFDYESAHEQDAVDEAFSIGNLIRKIRHLPDYWRESFRFYMRNTNQLRSEIIGAFTIASFQVPESIAFAYIAGVEPVSGLSATAWVGSITGVIGGRGATVSGAQGASAAVMGEMTGSGYDRLSLYDRRQFVFMACIMAGSMQFVFGFLQLARFATVIPVSVMIGFLNGLAVVIFREQLGAFRKCEWCLPTMADAVVGNATQENKTSLVKCLMENATQLYSDGSVYDSTKLIAFEECETRWLTFDDNELYFVFIIVVIVMFTCWALPKVPSLRCGCCRVKLSKLVPPPAVALIVATLFEHAINRRLIDDPTTRTRTVADTGHLARSPPPPAVPDVPDGMWGDIMKYAAWIAICGLAEALLTLRVLDEEVGDTPSRSGYRSGQECVAQGIGNVVAGFTGCMGGGAQIGESRVNVVGGARGRLSTFLAGLLMFFVVGVLGPAVELLPIAALTGVLFVVVVGLFEWDTIWPLNRCILATAPWEDRFTIILVTLLAFFTNLAIAFLGGLAFSSFCYVWNSSSSAIFSVARGHRQTPDGKVGLYTVRGSLFSGTIAGFSISFAPLALPWSREPRVIHIDFKQGNVVDFSAVAAIREICKRYKAMPIPVGVKRVVGGPPGWTLHQAKCGTVTVASLRTGGAADGLDIRVGHVILKAANTEEELEERKKPMTRAQIDRFTHAAKGAYYVFVAEKREVKLTGLNDFSKSALRAVSRKSFCIPSGATEPPIRKWLRDALDVVHPAPVPALPPESEGTQRRGSPGLLVTQRRGSPGQLVTQRRGSPGQLVTQRRESPGLLTFSSALSAPPQLENTEPVAEVPPPVFSVTSSPQPSPEPSQSKPGGGPVTRRTPGSPEDV
eukprot:Hpha_TRINITY_DN8988_c0_g1::TRINITY_DN8988_c0_g1_i1::g.81026::m.81026/K03321/TC.SULP; sulfate permease, SulP family